jgi:hypothetical protein
MAENHTYKVVSLLFTPTGTCMRHRRTFFLSCAAVVISACSSTDAEVPTAPLGSTADGVACSINSSSFNSSPKVNATSTVKWTCTSTTRTMTGNGIPDHPVTTGNFATPISAFGFNYGVGGCQTYFVGCTPGAAASVTISPGGMTPININTSQGNTMAFWGVVSDTQTFTFADIYINDTNRYIVLDDIAMASYSVEPPPAETAEPGTLLQIAMGAGLLALARRRFQTQFI